MTAVSLYDWTRSEFVRQCAEWQICSAHAHRLWRYVYREGVQELGGMDDLPPRIRDRLAGRCTLARLPTVSAFLSRDGLTRKCLLQLQDGRTIETVSMGMPGRVTACISSQAGCPVGCLFCATGQAGFGRNLSTGEVVAQVLHVAGAVLGASQERLRNVVVMGMGEPFLNYDAVLRALDIVSDPAGLAIAAKRITISTVGVAAGIRRLADEGRPYSLAVSLHAATQAGRESLIPAARNWPLEELQAACRYYTSKLQRRIFFEWTMIAGQNDQPEQAQALADLLAGIPSHINLIPLNPTAGFCGAPGQAETVDRFQSVLRACGLLTTVRRRRGIEISAGCGQLAGAAAG